MKARICVSVSGTSLTQLVGRVEQAERVGADIIEVRLDSLRGRHDLSKLSRAADPPLIATNRPQSEKGSYAGSEGERLKVLEAAVDAGFEYADLESTTETLDTVVSALCERGAKVILSQHDYSRTPGQASLKTTLLRLRKHEPDICKIVSTAQFPRDNLTILDFLDHNHASSSMVCFAMGKAGLWSRVLAPFYGSSFTYASLGPGLETAPGQPTLDTLRRIYESLDLE